MVFQSGKTRSYHTTHTEAYTTLIHYGNSRVDQVYLTGKLFIFNDELLIKV